MPIPESEAFKAAKPTVPPTFDGVDYDDNKQNNNDNADNNINTTKGNGTFAMMYSQVSVANGP